MKSSRILLLIIIAFAMSSFGVSSVQGELWLRLTFNDYLPEAGYITVPNAGGSSAYYGRAHGVNFVPSANGVLADFVGDIASYMEIRSDSTTYLPSNLAANGMSMAYWVNFRVSDSSYMSLLTTGSDSPTTPDSIQHEFCYTSGASPPYTQRRFYDYSWWINSNYNIDTWYHIVYTYEATGGGNYTSRLYVDGSFVASRARGALVTDDKESLVGVTHNTAYGAPLDGEIDQMDIFNHTLDSTEVASLYAEGPVVVSNRVVAPTFAPPGGTYMQIEDITITSATAGTTIYYTTDGSTPTTASAVYTGPVSADQDMTMQAMAVKSGMSDSAIGFADYIIYYYTDNFLANRPRIWRNDNRIVWLDVEQYNDDQVFYNTCKASFVADSTSKQFDLPVMGNKRPLVRSLEITSDGTVVNPKVLTDSATCVDSDTPQTVAADISSAGMTNRQKADAVFYYLAEFVYWSSAPIEYVPGQIGYGCVPGAIVNSAGYATCAHLGPLMVPYWQAVGFTGGNSKKVRMGPTCSLIFHSQSEVYYDNDWHIYDLTQLCFYLEYDDVTLASGQDMVDDNNIVLRMRNDTGYDPTWVPPAEHALKYGCMFGGGTTGLPGTAYGGWTYPPIRTMAMTMGPGQSFTRAKSSEGFYWQAWDFTTPYTIATENGRRRNNYDEYIANGFVSYPLEPGETSFDGLVSTVSGLTLDSGATPPCQTTTQGQSGYFILPIYSPIAITDLRVDADFYRPSSGDTITVSYYSDDTQSYTTLFTVGGTGASVVVSQEVPILRGMHDVLVKFTFNSSTGTPCGLNSATVRARVQNNPRAIPPLELGDNVISYTSDSQSDDVSVSYIYVEQEELPIAIGWPNLQPGKVDAVFFCDKIAQTSIPITIANHGATAVTITPTVSHTPVGWTMSFTQASVVLDPNQAVSLALNCTPPGGSVEGIVGAELNFSSATYGDAHKRILLGVMDSVVAIQAEDGTFSGMSAIDDEGVSGKSVGPDPGMAGSGTTTYQVNVPRSDDYYLVVRLNMKTTNYMNANLLKFVVNGNTRYINRYVENNVHRRKQDHYVDRWEWFLHTDVITLGAGVRQVTLTGLKSDVYLDSFALVSSKDVADLVLMNQLYCPEGFDESIAKEIVSYDFNRSGDVGAEDLAVLVDGWLDKDIAYQETSGLLVMEAEHYSSNEDGDRWGPTAFVRWEEFSGENSMGDGFVQALPNECLDIDETTVEIVSPCLTYQVNFSTTGTYYLWFKGKGYDSTCDSVHYGLNGSVRQNSKGARTPVGSEFGWLSSDLNGLRATIVVSVPGEATIDIWMREDDTKLDRILLTTDEFYDPSISEPPESSYSQMADRRGDLNFDGVINMVDFSRFSGKWLESAN